MSTRPAVVTASTPPDPATGSDVEPARYRELIDEAVREFAARNFGEARSLFARAHTLFPNARTLRGLGLVDYELRNYGECITHLEAALASQVRPLEGELRSETQQVLARANDFVAQFVIDTKPSVSRVIVDGVEIELLDRQTLRVPVGDHLLEVQAPNYQPERRHLSVKGGERSTVTILFTPLVASEHQPPHDGPRRWYKNPWVWTAAGVLVAGASVGAGVASSRDDKQAPLYTGSAHVGLMAP